MVEWLKNNAATLIIRAGVIAVLYFSLRRYIKNVKSGGCAGCSGCSYKESCHSYTKSKDKS